MHLIAYNYLELQTYVHSCVCSWLATEIELHKPIKYIIYMNVFGMYNTYMHIPYLRCLRRNVTKHLQPNVWRSNNL